MVSGYLAGLGLLFGWEVVMANVWDRFGRLIGSVRKLGAEDLDTYDHKG